MRRTWRPSRTAAGATSRASFGKSRSEPPSCVAKASQAWSSEPQRTPAAVLAPASTPRYDHHRHPIPSDIAIAQAATLRPIHDVAAELGLSDDELELYGKYKAKIAIRALERRTTKGRLVVVTGINPTPAGEGKSTVTVGVTQALRRLGKNAILAIREPSLGPVFGVKGGAAGGGYSQVVPMEDINLHFTGDFHAITSAHNLL